MVPRFSPRTLAGALACSILLASASVAQGRGGAGGALRTIEDRTATMRKLDGLFPLYWDSTAGQLFMEISRFNTEVLHMTGQRHRSRSRRHVGLADRVLRARRSTRAHGAAQPRVPFIEQQCR